MRAAAVITTIMFAAAMAALPPVARAQGLGFGAMGGVTLATLHEDDNGETTPFDFRTGLIVGGFVTWPLGSRLALQSEVLFTQAGAKADQGGGTLDAET